METNNPNDLIEKQRKRMKEERKNAGKTLEQIGDVLGITKSTYRKWEEGKVERIPTDKIYEMADYLHISRAYLMGFDFPRIPDTADQAKLRNSIYEMTSGMSVEKLEKLQNFIKEYLL